jgi:hypothetical protein
VVEAVDWTFVEGLLDFGCNARAESRSVPNGFSMMMRVQPPRLLCCPSPDCSIMSMIGENSDGGVER